MQANTAPHHRTWLKLGLALLYLTPLAVFAKLAYEVRDGRPIALDISILEWIHRFANPTLDRLMITVTNFGGVEVIAAVTLGASVILFFLHRRREMSILLIGVGGAAALNLALKPTFARARPSLWIPVLPETNFSFPSGHAMMSSALAFSAIYILWHSRWRWIGVILGLAYALAVGFSRLYLGVHYPTDVIGGWAVSFIWLAVVARILAKSRPQASRRSSSKR